MFVSLLLGLIAIAPQAAEPTPAASPTPKPVCRREAPVGSNLTVKTCHTKAEWATIDGLNGDAARTTLNARRMARPTDR